MTDLLKEAQGWADRIGGTHGQFIDGFLTTMIKADQAKDHEPRGLSWADYCDQARHGVTFGKKDRDTMINRLRQAGMSDRKAAAVLGVDQGTMGNHPDEENSSSGRPRKPVYRPTPAEQATLQNAIVAAYRKGYRTATIAVATGITADAVVKYLNRAGVKRQRNRTHDPAEPLKPVGWKTTTKEAQPLYKTSTTVTLLINLVDSLKEDDAENRFAFNIRDALLADDQAWLDRARVAVSEAQAYLNRLVAVLEDQKARERAQLDPSRRDSVNVYSLSSKKKGA